MVFAKRLEFPADNPSKFEEHFYLMLRQFLCFSVMLIMFAGCGEPSAPPTPVASVRMTQDTATMVPGAKLALTASPLDSKGEPLSRTISWTSSNTSVATVVGGQVSGVAPGTATISATAMSVTGHTNIVVKTGAVLGPEGATLNLLEGRVVLVVPAGAIASSTQLIVDAVAPPVSSTRLVSGTSYSIDAPTPATQPFIMSLTYDPANIRTNAPQNALKLYTLKSGKWERIAGSVADAIGHTVTAAVTGYGNFAVLEQAPGTGEIFAGNEQSAVVGTSVPVRPAIRVMDSEGFPVPGIKVVFAVTSGNGAATGTSVSTDAAGVATVGDWTLGAVAGLNTLSATLTGAAGGPIEFRATGVAGAATALKFVQSPPTFIQNRATFPAITIQLLDKFGNNAPTSGTTVIASLTSGSGTLGGTVTRQTSTSGIATFSDLVFSGAAGPKTIAFTSGSLTGLTALLTVMSGSPQTIAVNSGDNQAALAGSAVSTPPSVKVTDADGNPVSGISVHFAVTAGGGSVTVPDVVTDAAGIAQVGSWVLGTVSGSNTLTASSSGMSSTAVFHATGAPGSAGRLAFVTSPSPSPSNRIAFPVQPRLQVQDQFGNAVSETGIQVTASIVSGGGQLTGTTTVATNSSGVATFTDLVLSGTVGPRTLQFASTGISSASASVTLKAGAAVSFTMNGGNNQTATVGTAVLTRPSVVLKDADANGVPGVTVTFEPQTASGTVTGGTATTDSLGVATVGSWTVGTTAGTSLLNASTSALVGTILQFTATTTAGAAASIVLDRGSNQRVNAGRGVQGDVMFRVLDAYGNGVPSATVNFIASQGGTLAQANATTFSNGFVVLPAWTLGPSAGTQTVTATVTGTTVPAATVTVNSVKTRIVTFGDSNTDIGFAGTSSTIRAVSYVSVWNSRPSATAPNSPYQLAGKIESGWSASYSSEIEAVNHGISETITDFARTTRGAPGARTAAGGFTRFGAEVLGQGYPWSGGEPTGEDYPNGAIFRTRAFVPTATDFAYISIGTNDPFYVVQPLETIANLRWMVENWISNGLPANHLFLATLPPNTPSNSTTIPQINNGIRALVTEKGINLIDIANYTSDDNGLTWKSSSLHVGDSAHYAESVRDWIAQRIVARMAAVTAPPQ